MLPTTGAMLPSEVTAFQGQIPVADQLVTSRGDGISAPGTSSEGDPGSTTKRGLPAGVARLLNVSRGREVERRCEPDRSGRR